MQSPLVHLAIAAVPAFLFLLGLLSLDSFKLVRLRSVLLTIAWGIVAALLAYALNSRLSAALDWPPREFSRYIAPVSEEALKALALVYLIRSQRVGFLVDAAIAGFAVGTGFALAENIYYLSGTPSPRIIVWIVRGCGTAILHGGTTTLFAIWSKSLTERKPGLGLGAFVPGWLAAVAVHSFFNHFFLSPLLSTLLILVLLPVLIAVVFRKSEAALREWIGVGFDTEAELLELIDSGRIGDSRVGQYLQSLRARFRGEVVADLLCFLRLHAELSVRAKGELMMREAGFRSQIEDDVREKLAEMRYLEASIGATGRLAMLPFLRGGGKREWELRILEEP